MPLQQESSTASDGYSRIRAADRQRAWVLEEELAGIPIRGNQTDKDIARLRQLCSVRRLASVALAQRLDEQRAADG